MTIVDDIKRSVCISDLTARYTEVRRRGRLHVCRCLCGQNSDRNPSFTLYDNDNHFHCFACGRHGSAIDLVMLVEGIDFKTALERLRNRSALNGDDDWFKRVIHPTPSTKPCIVTDDAYAVLNATTAHYQTSLQHNTNARRYVHERGLRDDTIVTLRIGYAGGDLGRALFDRGLDLTLAASMGLLTPRGEMLRSRIVFPVMDAQRRPVWLIGRALDDATQPKYLGLPDGLVHKQPLMLGTPVRGVIWVEGPFDLAALVQWGLDADYLLVALLGTAHARAVERLQDHLTHAPHFVALDQDDAGEQAAQAMIEQMPFQHVARLRWTGAKDCGALLVQGTSGLDCFLQAVASSSFDVSSRR